MTRVIWFLILVVFQPFYLSAQETDHFLVILVAARGLDYSNGHNLFRTMAKHPSDGSKNGDVGHAWIYLRGVLNGDAIYVEGGHSGELGCLRPKYFEGIINLYEYGYCNPTKGQMQNPRYEPNPIKYLWASPKDGFFQQGSGGHTPTYAIKVNISPEQFSGILRYIHPHNYDYTNYSITEKQCSSFATDVAAIAGLYLEDKITMKISPHITICGETIRLWTDPYYSSITFSSPDALENSMKLAVQEGRAQEATKWYKENYPKSNREIMQEWYESFSKLPERWSRAFLFR